MSSISIIGLGNMARAMARARSPAATPSRSSAATGQGQGIGRRARRRRHGGTSGAAPAGDIVILALPYAGAAGGQRVRGRTRGKVIVDITNPFDADLHGLVLPDGSSGAQEIAKAAPAGAHVVKAFNTVFRHVLAKGRPDVFIAGDDPQAKAGVAAFIESLGLRPLDVGPLKMAHWLEGAGVVTMGLAANGVGNWDFALGVDEFTG